MAEKKQVLRVEVQGTEDLIRLRGEIDKYERKLKTLKSHTKKNQETTGRQVEGLQHLESQLRKTRKEYRDGQKSLQNLKQFRNDESFRTYIRINRTDLPRADERSTTDQDLQQKRIAKLSNDQQMDY